MDPRYFQNTWNSKIPQPNNSHFIPNASAPAPVAEQRGIPSQESTQAVIHGAPPTLNNTWSIQQPPYNTNNNPVSHTHTSQHTPQSHNLAYHAPVASKRKRLDSNNMDPRNTKERRTLDDRPVSAESQLMALRRTVKQVSSCYILSQTRF